MKDHRNVYRIYDPSAYFTLRYEIPIGEHSGHVGIGERHLRRYSYELLAIQRQLFF
jgi:hypothetical protein